MYIWKREEYNNNNKSSEHWETSECIEEYGEITINTTTGGVAPYGYRLNGQSLSNNGVFNNITEGEYLITVIDNNGCSSEDVVEVNASPIANFDISESEFYLSNIPTDFTDESIDFNIVSWRWNFGNGKTISII